MGIKISNIEDFKSFTKSVESKDSYKKPLAFALGVRRKKEGKTLDVYFPLINWDINIGTAAVFIEELGLNSSENSFYELSEEKLKNCLNYFKPFFDDGKKHENIEVLKSTIDSLKNGSKSYVEIDVGIYFLFDSSKAVSSPEEGYFKLQAMSQRCVKPHEICFDGIFGILNNVAWTNYGPVLPEDLNLEILKYQFSPKPLIVSHIDKFPYMINYHAPSGVRVTDSSCARLGAYLGEGTTIMPAGYVNFNAGTLGKAMVEGRVSGGVVVGDNSDIGGGASIMGTLSGGNKDVLSIGSECLLGANAGAGISIGNGSTIEAGLYITAGMPVLLQENGKETLVKAKELSGKENVVFIRNGKTGQVICRPSKRSIELNSALHSNT